MQSFSEKAFTEGVFLYAMKRRNVQSPEIGDLSASQLWDRKRFQPVLRKCSFLTASLTKITTTRNDWELWVK